MDSGNNDSFDVAVIGGGINGCGIARDAARRGLSVLLCEAGDLACATSSASTKLIHGGLRYLEHGEFRLVRESLSERERLLRIAPHIIRPMRFLLVHAGSLRPAWMLRLGLAAYDLLAKRDVLPPTRSVSLATDPAGEPLKDGFQTAFEYSDCWVDDARLTVLNAVDAYAHGARVLTRTRLKAARPDGDRWLLEIDGAEARRAKVLVNAAGPWAGELRDEIAGEQGGERQSSTRLVQGSHIVVPSLFGHDRAYILQAPDRRVVFAIPFLGKYTLVGTTDREYEGDPAMAEISDEETDYLLDTVRRYFSKPAEKGDIVWTYSGVRGLHDDGSKDAQEVTRDYVLKADERPLPMVSVLGGKLTTYRKLAEAAVDMCRPWLGQMKLSDTGTSALPGGDMPVDGAAAVAAELEGACKGLGPETARRLAGAYGTEARGMLNGTGSVKGLGRDFGCGLYEAELEHLKSNEWAKTAEDALFRRTKLGIEMDEAGRDGVARWFGEKP